MTAMPPMPDEPDPAPTVADTLRTLIAEELRNRKRTLKQIAIDADVPYQVIQKWSRKETAKLDVGIAEKIYTTLTGRSFNSDGN